MSTELDRATTFLLEEYKRLVHEIELHLNESAHCINYSILASAAVWAWWSTAPEWLGREELAWIPAGLTFLWGLRWCSLQRALRSIGIYLRANETPDRLGAAGWETHLSNGGKYTMLYQGAWGGIYFILLLCANLYIGNFICKNRVVAKETTQTPATPAAITPAVVTKPVPEASNAK